jgi:hypothetical protein
MTVVADKRSGDAATSRRAGWASGLRDRVRRDLSWLAPSLVAVLNAIAFGVIAPNVNDLFAAVARESAALHGVGLSYWFSWYGGGSTPGNYSVLTPYLSAAIGAVPLASIATAATTPLAWIALRGTRHPVAGLWAVTFTAAMNLWSGRVPFALGCLLTVVTIIFLLRRQSWPAVIFAILTVAASPVSGAFLLIVFAGVFLTRPDWRRTVAVVGAPIVIGLVGVAVVFGQPGPESFSFGQLLQLFATLAVTFVAAPPNWLKTSIWLTLMGSLVVFLVPNGLGDNLLRFAWYCLPAVLIATSIRQVRIAVLAASIALGFSAKQSMGDVFHGAEQTASPAYYASLIDRLDQLRTPLRTYRLEVVDDGTRTSSFALLEHAMLARGYEYQEDNELNKVLVDPNLDATQYKLWLDNNAVGYVAISSTDRKMTPEYHLVSKLRPGYLKPLWSNDKWTLYSVQNPNPIVKRPVTVRSFSQSRLVLRVPCACAFTVRVRNPQNLTAVTTDDSAGKPVDAKLVDDGAGWTMMTTPRPGRYTLSGVSTPGLSH